MPPAQTHPPIVRGRWPRVMDRSAAAEYIGVAPRTLDSYREIGTLVPDVPYGAGGLRRYSRDQLDAFVDRLIAEGTAGRGPRAA